VEGSSGEVTPTTEGGHFDTVGGLLAERAANLTARRQEAEQKAKEARAKAKGKAKGKEKADDKPAPAGQPKSSQDKYVDMVKKKQQEEREEKQRILKRIADDRADRKRAAEARETAKLQDQKLGDVAASIASAPSSRLSPSSANKSGMVSLQVRLFDGSIIRSRFPSAQKLGADVREWIDSERTDGKTPYTFKVILTPLPNKTIDVTQEEKSLEALDLGPSSTLVLIPVANYSSAYKGGSSGVLGAFVAYILSFFTWITSLISGVFSGLGRRGPESDAEVTGDQPQDNPASRRNQDRIRGFRNPDDRRRDHQLYNGNSVSFFRSRSAFPTHTEVESSDKHINISQLNFEPRHDDEGEEMDN
jgi:hypothetical protein